MAIAEQFAGLQMDQLIGAPLRAAADASIQLATSTAEFINNVGFDEGGKVRTVAFGYQKRSVNEDGSSNLDEMKVDVPMLAIVPIPNLQVDEVNILFDMEVKQSERQESSLDMGASLTGSLKIGPVRVSVTGSVSAHQSNTRSSDNSAKYHVDVRATNHGIPEGLARVLDMMAANVAPALVDSTLKDGNGQNLSEQAKRRAERLKALRMEISQLERCLNAAKDGLENNIVQLKRHASTQQNIYQSRIMKLMNGLDPENADDQKLETQYSQSMDELNQGWNNFQNQASELIRMITDSGDVSDGVSDVLALKSLQEGGKFIAYDNKESCYNLIAAAQGNAVDSQKKVNDLEKKLSDKRTEYSNAVAGVDTADSENKPVAANSGGRPADEGSESDLTPEIPE